MAKQNLNELEKELEKRLKKREKKKRTKMKISGAGVKQLQKIIRNKTLF